MQDLIQEITATTKHKKLQFSSIKDPLLYFVLPLKKKTELLAFNTFQESISGK